MKTRILLQIFVTLCIAGVSTHSVADGADDCAAAGPDHYLCGIPAAEDLVLLPGTSLLVASVYDGSSFLNLIDAEEKRWTGLVPSERYTTAHDEDRFPGCPGPIGTEGLVSHGLYLLSGEQNRHTLYVVSHGARESIEVFDIELASQGPAATWVGCVLTPDGQEANSVAAMKDGSLLVTVPIEHGHEFADAMKGEATGAAYRWNHDDGSWNRLDATAQPYANGIELSRDESRFFIASSGLRSVISYSNRVPAEQLGSSETLAIVPDNLHWDRSGELITAGLIFDYEACNPYDEAGEFDLGLYASCARPYQVVTVEPDSLDSSVLAEGAANARFSNITMGVKVDDSLWIGTFAGDRVAYRELVDE